MKHIIKLLGILLYIFPNMGHATSPIYCENTIQNSTIAGIVTRVEDRSHLGESTYLIFSLDGVCGLQKFVVKRNGFSELNLKEIKKNILISYSAKRKLRFSVPTMDRFPEELDINLSQSVTLE